jgi:hypothetical protein
MHPLKTGGGYRGFEMASGMLRMVLGSFTTPLKS